MEKCFMTCRYFRMSLLTTFHIFILGVNTMRIIYFRLWFLSNIGNLINIPIWLIHFSVYFLSYFKNRLYIILNSYTVSIIFVGKNVPHYRSIFSCQDVPLGCNNMQKTCCCLVLSAADLVLSFPHKFLLPLQGNRRHMC